MTARLQRLPVDTDREQRLARATTWLRSFLKAPARHRNADLAMASLILVSLDFRKPLSPGATAWLRKKAESRDTTTRQHASALLEIAGR